MSTEKNIQQQEKANKNASQKKDQSSANVRKKTTGSIVSKLSLVISLAAVGLAGYAVTNDSTFLKDNTKDDKQYALLEKQIEKLKLNQDEQKGILDDVSAQSDSQTNSIKAIQSQVSTVSSQVSTPAKDIYLQMGVANIQSAIDYLTLAKDVAIFTGDTTKATALADMAFDKIEASKVANISASDRRAIKEALNNYLSKNDVVKDFVLIQQQVQKLEYITPETSENASSKQSKNKYMKLLGSIVQIQDIPKDQLLVSSNQSKQLVADGLYNALISLQSAMYTNSQTAIDSARDNLLTIIKKYFVQNDNAKSVEKELKNIKAQSDEKLDDSLSKVVSQLSKQQNELLSRDTASMNNSESEKGSEK
ncbi:membrane protein [Candidatus Francisella endociliophora]|uniref:Membrane protein n=1 Tax=Candidatus Francisella endociliophora TaxID=653937 RepID=A0A097ER46_9GAMM|nr:hypothetical protein [Francisella sp. FSC1006]AIT10051.1 membrane protein [Francisella sp. FSC1006]